MAKAPAGVRLLGQETGQFREVIVELRKGGEDARGRRRNVMKLAQGIEEWAEDVTNFARACLYERVIRVYRREHGGSDRDVWRSELAREWLDLLEDTGGGGEGEASLPKLFWQLCEVASLLIRYREMMGVVLLKRDAFAEVYECLGQEVMELVSMEADPLAEEDEA